MPLLRSLIGALQRAGEDMLPGGENEAVPLRRVDHLDELDDADPPSAPKVRAIAEEDFTEESSK